MSEEKSIVRIVRLKEVKSCLTLRLDPSHYIPKHREWECKKGDRLRSRGRLVKAWLNGEISSEELLEAIRIKLGRGGGVSDGSCQIRERM